MTTNELEVLKIIPAPRETIFRYLTDAKLIEQWANPEGFSLKVPKFEAKIGGRYRYEHTGKDGLFVCEGRVDELVADTKLVQVDEFINAPDGKALAKNLVNTITLDDTIGGTEVIVIVKGDFDDKFMKECETGWNQCFDHLKELIAKESGAGFKGKSGEARPSL